MSTVSAGGLAAEQRVRALMAGVERLVAERRDADAQRLLKEAEAILPDHPLVLHEQARRLLAAGNAAAARPLLERVVTLAPGHVPFWLSLAAVQRVLGLRDEELRTLDRALALDPTHVVVLLQKGALLDLMSKPRSAAAIYTHALQVLSPGTVLPPAVEAHVMHARERVRVQSALLGELIDDALAPLTKSDDSAGESPMRFERCLDQILGRRRIYRPEPTGMLFPYLSDREYYDRALFPWLESLEAATGGIREELLAVMDGDSEGMQPYITFNEALPLRQWRELNHSRRWSAYFLWNQGSPEESHLERCPRTAAVLATLPQVHIPGRGPTAFFSILDAHTHIPAHTGVTNTRLTVHLPLIVPPGCRFRVGGEIREWREGEAWVFDDTIEHEAWNDSDVPRAILLFDVWHPELTARERDLVRGTVAVMTDYYSVEGEIPGVVI